MDVIKNINHDNIVKYIGCELVFNHFCLYFDYTSGLPLSLLLTKYGKLSESVTIKYARQVLNGLCCLHEQGIVHGDIRSSNVLVDASGTCKLTEFGKSIEVQLLDSVKSPKSLEFISDTLPWMAPEVVNSQHFGRKIDVWSFGCLLAEMLTGEKPWVDISIDKLVLFIGLDKKAPKVKGTSLNVTKLLEACFDPKYETRMTSSELRILMDNYFEL